MTDGVTQTQGVTAVASAGFTSPTRIWEAVRRGYEINRFNNPHVIPVMTTPPTVAQASAIQLLNPKTIASLAPGGGFTSQFYPTGGIPFNTGSGFFGFAAFTTSNPPGNLGSNVGCLCFRVKVVIDAIAPVFAVGASVNALRFLVNGQYVNTTGIVPATTPSFIQLTFASRAKREIWIEGSTHTLVSISVQQGESIQPAPFGLRGIFLGDSITVGTGATLNMDAFAAVMADALGLVDVHLSGLGGQGVQALESSGTWNLQNRLTTSTNANAYIYDAPPADIYFLCMGTNDTTFSFASNVTAYVNVITQILAQYPSVPIVVIGCPANNSGPNEVSCTTDLAIAAAVTQLNLPQVIYISDASRGQYAIETGVGNTTTPTSGVITLTAAPTAATSGTLTAGFPGLTGVYTITFSGGTTKPVTLTSTSTAVSWTGAVTDASASLQYNGLTTLVKPLAGAVAATATSATQASNWGFPSGNYMVTFSSGETRLVAFANGAATMTWTNPLLFPATVNIYIAFGATIPGDGDIYYAQGSGPHPNTLGHASRGIAYADNVYQLAKLL